MTTVLRGLIVRSIGLSAGLGLIILLIAAMLSMGCSRPARSATKAGVTPPGTGSGSTPRTLRVCADPNNLPFSNNRLEGFENRLADLLATELHATVEYTWWAQRRGHVRHTISAGASDVLHGVPGRCDLTRRTRSLIRASYLVDTSVARVHEQM